MARSLPLLALMLQAKSHGKELSTRLSNRSTRVFSAVFTRLSIGESLSCFSLLKEGCPREPLK